MSTQAPEPYQPEVIFTVSQLKEAVFAQIGYRVERTAFWDWRRVLNLTGKPYYTPVDQYLLTVFGGYVKQGADLKTALQQTQQELSN